MEKSKTEKEEKKEGRITVDIRGEVLKAAIALRHEREKKEDKVISISDVVRDAVTEKYKREIGKKEAKE